jgi:hypothetical protein
MIPRFIEPPFLGERIRQPEAFNGSERSVRLPLAQQFSQNHLRLAVRAFRDLFFGYVNDFRMLALGADHFDG